MSPVEPCLTSDIAEVACLHAKLFLGSSTSSTPGLEAYYRETFFEHPWIDSRIAPLVYRDNGHIISFLGVIPRPMRLNGNPITAAVIHRVMVDPDAATPFTARVIMEALLGGPQALSVSDSASATARAVWQSMKKEVVLPASLDWFKTVRPGALAASLLSRRPKLRPFTWLAKPLFAIGDMLADTPEPSGPAAETPIAFEEAPDDQLLGALTKTTAARPLTPEYTLESWRWLMERLRGNTQRGKFEARLAVGSDGEIRGVCAWYERPDRVMEVLLLTMDPSRRDAVLDGLFRTAQQSGMIAMTGRLDGEIMRSTWIQGCRLEQRLWTLVHSSDPRLSLLFHRGEAMFSGLDCELWVPYDAAEFGSWPS